MKPILFNTEMVRALLEGRKTVTRRVVKPQPEGQPVPMGADSCWPGCFAIQGTTKVIRPPYYLGEVLWVRETWAHPSNAEIEKGTNPDIYLYKADGPLQPCGWNHWRPSIHMPREAARIFLRVTGVRVERLQELTLKDAEMEGMDLRGPMFTDFVRLWDSTVPRHPNKFKRYPYYWEDDPWVWVIQFERINGEGRR